MKLQYNMCVWRKHVLTLSVALVVHLVLEQFHAAGDMQQACLEMTVGRGDGRSGRDGVGGGGGGGGGGGELASHLGARNAAHSQG